MIDLGQTFYERQQYFFNDLSVHQIVINPRVKGYPPIFMLCKEKRGSKWCEYILGATFIQVNKLMMNAVDNTTRLSLAERLAEALMPATATDNISLRSLLGKPLRLSGLDMTTILHRFKSDDGKEKLYYFQLTDV